MSLDGVESPRAIEPMTKPAVAPLRQAISSILSRRAWSDSSVMVTKFIVAKRSCERA
jgi:hypothetical protein